MSLGMSADAAHWSLPELSWYLCVGAATAHTSSSVTGSSICCWWPRITGENEMSRLELYRSLCSPWFRSQCSLAKFARSFVLSDICFGFLLGGADVDSGIENNHEILNFVQFRLQCME